MADLFAHKEGANHTVSNVLVAQHADLVDVLEEVVPEREHTVPADGQV